MIIDWQNIRGFDFQLCPVCVKFSLCFGGFHRALRFRPHSKDMCFRLNGISILSVVCVQLCRIDVPCLMPWVPWDRLCVVVQKMDRCLVYSNIFSYIYRCVNNVLISNNCIYSKKYTQFEIYCCAIWDNSLLPNNTLLQLYTIANFI